MTQCTMNSFRPIILMVIVLTIGLAPVAGQAQTPCGEITETALIAGQNIPVGTVVVENDEQYLYVTYQTDGNWLIIETHLHNHRRRSTVTILNDIDRSPWECAETSHSPDCSVKRGQGIPALF